MAFDDQYRIGAHGIFMDDKDRILLLKATYTDKSWGLPGGAIDPGETIHEALHRECMEELGVKIQIKYLSGIYYHQHFNSHVCIFRCEMPTDSVITLSSEHSEFKYFKLDDIGPKLRDRVLDCINFGGTVKSAKF